MKSGSSRSISARVRSASSRLRYQSRTSPDRALAIPYSVTRAIPRRPDDELVVEKLAVAVGLIPDAIADEDPGLALERAEELEARLWQVARRGALERGNA